MNIALIGGIGSGKSEVLKVAREMGIAALSADEINAGLLKSPEYIEKIAAAFPGCVVCGVVDKARLASEVFSDKGKREKLNSIAHPEIARKVAECKESPLVVERECSTRSFSSPLPEGRAWRDSRDEAWNPRARGR